MFFRHNYPNASREIRMLQEKALCEKTSAVYPTKPLSFYDFMGTAGQKKGTTSSFQVNEGIISYSMK